MISRERIKRSLAHREIDRVAIQDRVWETTENRWRKEGLPKELSTHDFFDYEITRIWIDTTPQFSGEILHQDNHYRVERSPYGQIVKHYIDSSLIGSPVKQVIDSPVKTRRDWERMAERLKPSKSRLIRLSDRPNLWLNWKRAFENFRLEYKKGKFIAYSGQLNFGLLHRYLGIEQLLISMVTDSEWIRNIAMNQAKLFIRMYELMVQEGFRFDGVYLSNDMGSTKGLLFSPDCYREQFLPADKLVCEYFHGKDMPVIVHSDGDVKELIPDLIKVGFSCLEPLEVKAGMDVIKLKKQYGKKLALMGGIDVRIMADQNDPYLIEDEIKTKFTAAKEGSGYIYHSDHSIPDNVSFERYRHIIQLITKYGKYD